MMLTGILGALLGWDVGIVATPYNRSEANRLGDVSKVAHAALTGYVIAKFDRLFDALFVSNVVIFPYVGLASGYGIRKRAQCRCSEEEQTGGGEGR
jgi:hypothetical protein